MENRKYFNVPLWCPLCKEELENDGTFLFCPNTECVGLRRGNLGKWIKSLDVNDISDKTIELLERAGMLNNPSDFYRLDVNAMSNLEGMGVRSATKIVDNFKEKNTMDLATFIDGLNINNFSKTRAETLIENGIDTLDKMLEVKEEKLITFKGIGNEVANSIIIGLHSKRNTIEKLLKVVKIIDAKEPEEIVMSSEKMKDQVVVFTGAIQRIDENGGRFTRKMLENLVYENGGSCQDSITSKNGVTMLVQADAASVSSKSKKANELKIKIVSEASFFKMIGIE